MPNRESLLIDMDGVLADTMGGAFDYAEKHYGHQLSHEDIQDYWFAGLPKEVIIEALQSEGFYRDLDVMTGAVRAVNRLRKEYDVYICTSPMKGAEDCEFEKRDWIEEHFDTEFALEAIVTSDKRGVPGRAIIEDNPHIGGGMWQPIIYDQPYNRTVEHPRMYGWHDLYVVRSVMGTRDYSTASKPESPKDTA